MRDEKEERKKQARSNKQTRQSNTAYSRQSALPGHVRVLCRSIQVLLHVLCTHVHVALQIRDSEEVPVSRALPDSLKLLRQHRNSPEICRLLKA